MKIKINEGYIIQKSGSKSIIVSIENSEIYTLNKTATLIFEFTKNGMSKSQILSRLSDIYNVYQDDLVNDIEKTLKFFKDKKIIIYK